MSCQVQEISPIDVLRANWHHFNRNYRETITYLWALSQKYNAVFPCYDRMAEMCGYSRRTAINICNVLCKLGLICWVRRGYRSNLYFLPDELVEFDLRNQDLSTKPYDTSCTISCTVLDNIDSLSHVHNGSPTAPVPSSTDVPISQDEKQQKEEAFRKLPHILQQPFMKDFDFQKGSWILDRLCEQQMQEIIKDMRWYAAFLRSKNEKVHSYCGLFVKMALKFIGLKPKIDK